MTFEQYVAPQGQALPRPAVVPCRDRHLAEDPDAPGSSDPGRQLRERTRRRWTAGAAGVLVAAGIAGAVVLGNGSDDAPHAPPVAAPAGEVPSSGTASCVEAYSPQAVAGRGFAFDGTVIAIGPALSNGGGAPLPLVGVTLRVHQWFRGGTGETVTVDMHPPDGASRTDEPVAAYGVGSRLLVSGEPRWGGAPLEAAIAWGCGFTRYHDPGTAAEWAAATG